MPNDIQLATIDKVDLRSVWENEAADFTPWLGENLAALGEALGLDLELQAQEAPVGGFSLDLLAHEPNTNRPVIIENQLETTDHDHLGKLITYASGYDANVVVWITREFKDEHRQALDWLNQRSSEDTEFFGVVVEVWKIDDSRPAPHFRVVSAPNDWHKSNVKIRSTGDPSPQQERYRAFFQKLIDTLREQHRFTGARKAQPMSWYSFSAGHAQRVRYGANFFREGVRIEVYIDNGDQVWNKDIFDQLSDRREQIQSAIKGDFEWNWDRLDDRRASRISVERPGSIGDDENTLDEIHVWMVKNLLEFKRVFGPHLAELVD